MKHASFSFLIIFTLLSGGLFAQNFSAGSFIGGNFNKSYSNRSSFSEPYDGAPGLLLGIYGDYKKEAFLGIRSELSFLALGMKTPVSTFHQNYLALSILPRLRLGQFSRLEVGAQGGLSLNESLPNIKRFHPMGLAGVSCSFGRIETGLHYFQSLSPYYREVSAASERKFFYRGVQLILGYRIL
jgi:hypothetical protein